MAQFSYQATGPDGKRHSGSLSAATEAEARGLLRTRRFRVNDLAPKKSVFSFASERRASQRDIAGFTRQLASMNAAAIPLIECLSAIGDQAANPAMGIVASKISADVQSGLSLAEALSRHPKVFNRLYCSMIKAGESAGILPQVLIRLADYQEKAVAVSRRVKSAFAYPALVGLVAAGALVALMTFVVPTFSSMLAELGATLPLSTRIVIGISEFIKQWLLPATIMLGAGIGGGVYFYNKNERLRLAVDGVTLRLPLFGALEVKTAIARFSRTFGSLLSGGVPIAEALEITAGTAGNRIIENALHKALEAIRSGQPLAQPLRETGIFPSMVLQMVGAGEKGGNLPDMLEKIADYYDAEADSAITMLTSILEPLLIVVMGVIIAGVLISMYLPMFEMVGSIG